MFYFLLDKIPGKYDEKHLCRFLVNISIVEPGDLNIVHHSCIIDFQLSNQFFVLFSVFDEHAKNYEYGLDSKTEDKRYVLQLPGYKTHNVSYTYIFEASLIEICCIS